MPYIILVAGIPASGKTTYARHISEKLNIPFIGRDAVKEKLYDVLKYDTSKRENSQLYGMASYSVFCHIAECLMRADVSFVFETNFWPASVDILLPMVRQYNYRALTILFDADIKVLHKRFCERDITNERHPGLVAKGTSNLHNFDSFSKELLPHRDFCVGEKIIVDTTDFSKVDYDEINDLVMDFIRKIN